MRSVAGGIDGLEVVFDDGSLVGDGGLLLAGTVMHRLGLEALIEVFLTLRDRLRVFSSRIGGCAVVVVWSC